MTTSLHNNVDRHTFAEHVLAVDPALNSIGVAAMLHGKLTSAARLVPPKDWAGLVRGERYRRLAEIVFEWAHSRVTFSTCAVVYEHPQAYYHAGADKVDKNDLIAIAVIGAMVAGRVATYSREVLAPTPAEWTQGLPKTKKGNPWLSPRGARLLSRLTPGEQSGVEKSHDAIDAACLALWAVGRWGRVRAHHT